jgi:hypothetical protein
MSDVLTAAATTALLAFYMVLEWKLLEMFWIWTAMK